MPYGICVGRRIWKYIAWKCNEQGFSLGSLATQQEEQIWPPPPMHPLVVKLGQQGKEEKLFPSLWYNNNLSARIDWHTLMAHIDEGDYISFRVVISQNCLWLHML